MSDDSADPTAFEPWLRRELRALKVDDEVFLPYLVSILEGDDDGGLGEDDQEVEAAKSEELDELIGGIGIDDDGSCQALRDRILARWRKRNAAGSSISDNGNGGPLPARMEALNLSATLASISESQTAAYVASRAAASANASTPDRSVKEAILAQYSGAVEESSEDEDGDEKHDPTGVTEERNANAAALVKAEQEKREACRAAALAKKEKDKEDREKQKTAGEERKKKAQDKAAKGERRK